MLPKVNSLCKADLREGIGGERLEEVGARLRVETKDRQELVIEGERRHCRRRRRARERRQRRAARRGGQEGERAVDVLAG